MSRAEAEGRTKADAGVSALYDLGAERGLLALIFEDERRLAQVNLDPDDFYSPAHRDIYLRMLRLRREGRPITFESVFPEIDPGRWT
jgi:replicative DNA helicase